MTIIIIMFCCWCWYLLTGWLVVWLEIQFLFAQTWFFKNINNIHTQLLSVKCCLYFSLPFFQQTKKFLNFLLDFLEQFNPEVFHKPAFFGFCFIQFCRTHSPNFCCLLLFFVINNYFSIFLVKYFFTEWRKYVDGCILERVCMFVIYLIIIWPARAAKKNFSLFSLAFVLFFLIWLPLFFCQLNFFFM